MRIIKAEHSCERARTERRSIDTSSICPTIEIRERERERERGERERERERERGMRTDCLEGSTHLYGKRYRGKS